MRDEVWGYLWLCPLWRGRLGCEKVVSLQLLVIVKISGGGGGWRWRDSDSVRSGELVSCVAPCEGWGSLYLLAMEGRSVCSSLRGVRCVGVGFLVLSAVEGCLCIAPNQW